MGKVIEVLVVRVMFAVVPVVDYGVVVDGDSDDDVVVAVMTGSAAVVVVHDADAHVGDCVGDRVDV